MKSKLAKLIDSISVFIIFFIALYWLLNKTNLTNKISVLLSLFLTTIISVTLLKIINDKNKRNSNLVLEKTKTQDIVLALKFGDPIKIKIFWERLFSKNYNVLDKDTHLKLTKEDKNLYFYYDFTSPEITLSKLKEVSSDHKNEQIIFCADKFSVDATTFVNFNKNIQLLDTTNTIELINKYKTFPTIKKYNQLKYTVLQKFTNSITKQKALKFIKYGTLLLVLGIILNKNYFYIFFSIIFYILAILSFIKKSTNSSKRILDI